MSRHPHVNFFLNYFYNAFLPVRKQSIIRIGIFSIWFCLSRELPKLHLQGFHHRRGSMVRSYLKFNTGLNNIDNFVSVR